MRNAMFNRVIAAYKMAFVANTADMHSAALLAAIASIDHHCIVRIAIGTTSLSNKKGRGK